MFIGGQAVSVDPMTTIAGLEVGASACDVLQGWRRDKTSRIRMVVERHDDERGLVDGIDGVRPWIPNILYTSSHWPCH